MSSNTNTIEKLQTFSDTLSRHEDYKYTSKTQIAQLYEYLVSNDIDTNEFCKNPPHPSNISDTKRTYEGSFGIDMQNIN